MGGQPRKASKLRWSAFSPAGECALVNPIGIKSAVGEKPCAVDLHEGVEVTERGNHHASLLIVDCQVMRQALTLGCAPIICQRECGGLPDEVRGGFVFARLGEHLRKRFARMKFLTARDPSRPGDSSVRRCVWQAPDWIPRAVPAHSAATLAAER
jgi:hypothetical protein